MGASKDLFNDERERQDGEETRSEMIARRLDDLLYKPAPRRKTHHELLLEAELHAAYCQLGLASVNISYYLDGKATKEELAEQRDSINKFMELKNASTDG